MWTLTHDGEYYLRAWVNNILFNVKNKVSDNMISILWKNTHNYRRGLEVWTSIIMIVVIFEC